MLGSLRRFLNRTAAGGSEPARPRLPDGIRVYAVGDVHGRADCLGELVAQIEAHQAAFPIADPRIVLLGDLIDRGPDSAGIVELLCRPALAEGIALHVLLGNHEQMMLQFIEEPGIGRFWLPLGGQATLASYGVDCRGALTDEHLTRMRDDLLEKQPLAHRRLLEGCTPSLEIGDYLFVHAGVRPGVPLAQQRVEDLLWIREPFLSSPRPSEHVVVHGHDIVSTPEFLPGRIGIDTGAYRGGVLTCLVLEGGEQTILQTRPDSARKADGVQPPGA